MLRHSDVAWLALALMILAYEAASPEGELLSEGWDRYLERFPVAARLLPLVLTFHVINLIPRRFDPVSGLFDLVCWLKGK